MFLLYTVKYMELNIVPTIVILSLFIYIPVAYFGFARTVRFA